MNNRGINKSTIRLSMIPAFLGIIALICLNFPGITYGSPDDFEIRPQPGDDDITITQRLDPKNITLSKVITLTVTGTDAKGLLMERGPLTDLTTKATIDKSNLSVENADFTKGQPKDIKITILNVVQPGTYSGKAFLYFPGHEDKKLPIRINVHLQPPINVTAVASTIAFQVIHCTGDCLFVDHLPLPQALLGGDRSVGIINNTTENVAIESAAITLEQNNTGEVVPTTISPCGGSCKSAPVPLSSANLILAYPSTIPAGGVFNSRLFINREELLPGRYSGTITYKIRDLETPLTVNATLDVRADIWTPLLFLVLGLLVGRAVQIFNSPRELLKERILGQYRDLGIGSAILANKVDSAYFSIQRQKFMEILFGSTATDTDLTNGFNTLQKYLDGLRHLESLEVVLSDSKYDGIRDEVTTLTAQARTALEENNDYDTFTSTLVEIKDKMAPIAQGVPLSFAATLTKEPPITLSVQTTVVRNRAASILALLAGTGDPANLPQSATAFLLYIRPLLFIFLIILLTLIGFQSLYISSGSTFGVNGLFDYLGLFLWGLSTSVATSTLSNLPALTARSI